MAHRPCVVSHVVGGSISAGVLGAPARLSLLARGSRLERLAVSLPDAYMVIRHTVHRDDHARLVRGWCPNSALHSLGLRPRLRPSLRPAGKLGRWADLDLSWKGRPDGRGVAWSAAIAE